MPGASTLSQVFTSDAALATAVMLGVNRPNYVPLALWRALNTGGDANAEVDRLLDAVLKACIAAKKLPPRGPLCRPVKGRPRGYKFTETEVTAAGPAAVAAYQALQSFLVVSATLPVGGEAALRAAFESKAMFLYAPGQATNREKRFATVRVQFP